MAKGVKKIKHVKGSHYPDMSVYGKRITIEPEKEIIFDVAEWLSGTTPEDKKKPIKWMRQSNDRLKIVGQVSSTTGYMFQITKQLCGSYHYYIEASLSGNRDFKNITGLYVKGWCPPKIVSSKWCTQKGGDDVRKTYTFSYGHIIYLYLDTEGLNGDKVTVDVYKVVEGGGGAKDDRLIHTYTNVEVIDGQINLKIGNSSLWYGKIGNPKAKEEFYVKVKTASGKYVSDGKDTIHARFLRIKNEVVSKAIEPSTNNTPTKVYKPDVNAARYEPCKFEVVKITESEVKDGKANNTTVTVFDNGKGLKKKPGTLPQEKIERTIFFKFDSTIIDKDGEAVLNNILKFLLEHKGATMNLSGYACVIGRQNYNKGLSQRRADVVKKFFADGGLEAGRIISVGRGEVDPTDDKQGRDNIKYRNEYSYEQNRRVDISFVFYAHDAQTIVYEVIAPSVDTKKELTIDIVGQEAKACFRAKDKHTKETWIVDVGQAIDKGDTKQTFTTPSFNYGVYSPLSRYNPVGGIGFDTDALKIMQYIWPASSSPNQFHLHVHSCRWFSEKKNTTVLIKAYPDVKWTFNFFLNLTNDLGVKWRNLDPKEHKDWQKKAGKMGAERRWKQKDASFGFSLKAKWNKDKRENELKYEYETKIKKLYDVFASIGAIADGITNKTKGCSPTGIPMTFAVKPPNLSFTGDWYLEHPKDNKLLLGTYVKLNLIAKPLIGLEVTIDLLGTAIFVGSQIVGAGPGVTELYKRIQGKLKSGIKAGKKGDKVTAEANIDIYMDLIITQSINLDTKFEFNTSGKAKDSMLDVKGESKLKVELKIGAKLKGEVTVVIATVSAYFEGSGSGDASITFGHSISYDDDKGGLFYRPILGFDGLNAKYIVEISAGLAVKLGKHNVDDNQKLTLLEGEYPNVIPPFDVIKELEQVFGISANIPLIKNDK